METMQAIARPFSFIERLFAALYVSEIWWQGWLSNCDYPVAANRKYALACKAKALITYDRIIFSDERVF